jgi:hypothetical protein
MNSTPSKRRSLGKIFGLFSPIKGCKKEESEMKAEFDMRPHFKRDNSLNPLHGLETDENLTPREAEQENKLAWKNPDTIMQKTPRVFRTSTLGHGHEHVDKDVNELSQHLAASFNDKTFADVVLKVGPQGRPIYAHKVILTNRSLFFRAEFSKPMQNEKVTEKTFSEYSYGIVESVVKYMYSGNITLKLENVLDVLDLAEKFQVRSLSVLACNFIETNLDYNNVSMVFQAISQYRCPSLYAYCLSFIDKAILNVVKSDSFLDLSEELLILIISRDQLALKPSEEINIFHAVHVWAKHNAQTSDTIVLSNQADRALKHVRFPLMPKDDLTNIVEQSKFVPQDLLMEAYKNHCVPQQSNHERFTPRLMNSRRK